MNLSDVLRRLSPELSRSMAGIAPEIVLVATIVLMLVVRICQRSVRSSLSGLAMMGTLVALVFSVLQLLNIVGSAALDDPRSGPMGKPASFLARFVRTSPPKYSKDGTKDLFTHDEAKDLFTGAVVLSETPQTTEPQKGPFGMLRFDGFTVFFRIFLLVFVALVIWLTKLTGIPDNEDSPDFYTLLLGATLGMSLMVSANHLLMVYIAVEMASLPSYAMAGFLKGRREASEASLKYVVFGAGASGIMLYGISLLVGKYGTAHIPSLALAIAHGGTTEGVLLLGLLLVLVGIAFKIAAVPFHFWCPDVFEGAAAEVAGFLSVASKAAALGLLARLAISLTTNQALATILDRPPVHLYLAGAIGVLAAITATYGNLAAYAQTNLKRLLAYSTIAHAGYMMMPVAAALMAAKEQVSAAQPALESLVFYLMIYLFMNLGAFTTVALIRNQIRSEDLKDYAGLIRRCPFLTVAMAVFLLSLTGIPPLAGFAAKFRILSVLYNTQLFWLMAVLLANTVFSAFYYIKVLRVMIIEPSDLAASTWHPKRPEVVYCGLLIAANLAVMLLWKAWDMMDGLTQLAVPDLLESF